MKERPIIFSGPMVRAILAGTKTQTRRVADIIWDTSKHWGGYDCWTFRKRGKPMIGFSTRNSGQNTLVHHCPHGAPGDLLWVREMFAMESPTCAVYLADQDDKTVVERWKPSIHMPRKLSRLTLEIVSVRVERLQDIKEQDAKAEGVEASKSVEMKDGSACYTTPYQKLWNQINGCDAWDKNPWVWVIEFKKL